MITNQIFCDPHSLSGKFRGIYEDHKIMKVRESGHEVPLLTDLSKYKAIKLKSLEALV